MNGKVCKACGGKGCLLCNYTGYSEAYFKNKGGTKMAKVKKTFHTPSGGTYTRMVEEKSAKKTKTKKATKSQAKLTSGSVVHHKAYEYINKAGKTVKVPAHDEYPKGGKPASKIKTKTKPKTTKAAKKKVKTPSGLKTLK